MTGVWAVGRLWRLVTLRTTGPGRAGPEPGESTGATPTGDPLDDADERRAAIGGAWWIGGDDR